MSRIYTIESSNNPDAHNKSSGARGLGQITEVALADFNKETGANITSEQLFDRETNEFISDWYMNQRVPQLLEGFGIEDTLENRLAAYNWGVGNLQKHLLEGKQMPTETEDYIIKYHLGGDITSGQQRLKDLGFNPGKIDGIYGDNTKAAFKSFQESDTESQGLDTFKGITTLKR